MTDRTPRRTGTTPAANETILTGGRRVWLRRLLLGLLVVPLVVVGLAGVLAFYLVFSRVPLPDDLAIGETVVLDVDGNEIGALTTEQSRREVDATTLPDHVTEAVLAAEDRGFYGHNGVSVTGIARALVTNVRTGDLTGQGGSTITQQYVKNALLTPEQTVTRKLNEAALSIKLERAYSKDEILSFYLSTIYWGRGAYGIESAAQTYYGTSADGLSVNQAATLAGIIRAPEALDPTEQPEPVERRRLYVLDGMLDEGWIDQAEHDRLVAEGTPPVTGSRALEADGDAAYYLDAVRRELAPLVGDAQLYAGLTIRTAMRPAAQAAAQAAVAEAVAVGDHDSAALVAVDPATGGVIALVGGPDFATQQLNVAVQGSNQLGSAFKPFTLTRWVTDGISPASVYPAPATLEVGGTSFRNYGGSAYGDQSVRQATVTSTNTVYVQMQQDLGGAAVIDTAVALGLPPRRGTGDDATDTMAPTAGLTLGQDQFTVAEVAGAYATLASGGVRRAPHLVTEVRDRDGVVVYEAPLDDVRAVDENVAAVVSDVLVDVVASGTGSAAALEDRPVAGKTGTTNDNRDAWFAGYTPQLAAAVWVGNLDDTPVEDLTGGGSAAPVWRAFAAEALAGTEPIPFPTPDLDGLEERNVELAACPTGYERREPPNDVTDGLIPDIIDDGEDLPCVEISPSPSPTPSPSPSPTPSPSPSPAPPPEPPPPPAPSPEPEPSPDPLPTPTPTAPIPTPTVSP